jgi:hypothetical protein
MRIVLGYPRWPALGDLIELRSLPVGTERPLLNAKKKPGIRSRRGITFSRSVHEPHCGCREVASPTGPKFRRSIKLGLAAADEHGRGRFTRVGSRCGSFRAFA